MQFIRKISLHFLNLAYDNILQKLYVNPNNNEKQ